MKKLKTCLATLGLGASLLMAGSAYAGISWNPYPATTLFEDDLLDFLYDKDLNAKPGGTIEVGDVLVTIFEVNDAGGSTILPDELTGVLAIQVSEITPAGGLLSNISFDAYEGGLNSVLGTLGDTSSVNIGADGDAGGGALVAMFLDPTPDLDISATNLPVPPGSFTGCDSLGDCIDNAVNGELFQVDGFTGEEGTPDGDEYWFAGGVALDTTILLNTEPGTGLGTVSAGLSILVNNTGQELVYNEISCFPLCGGLVNPGGDDGYVDMVGSGSIKGGVGLPAGLIGDAAFATGDFDFQKLAVPEPGSLALLSVGLIGLGAIQRRRRRNTSEV